MTPTAPKEAERLLRGLTPAAFIIGGDDNAHDNGHMDAWAWQWSEFTTPVYNKATVLAAINEAIAPYTEALGNLLQRVRDEATEAAAKKCEAMARVAAEKEAHYAGIGDRDRQADQWGWRSSAATDCAAAIRAALSRVLERKA